MEKRERETQHYDKIKHTKENNIKLGDQVLVRAPRRNKLSTNFGAEEFTVTERKGDAVTLRSEKGKEYKRNVSHVQKIVDFDEEEVEEENDANAKEKECKDDCVEEECEKEGSRVERREPKKNTSRDERPKRNVKIPERYSDYRMYSISVMRYEKKKLLLARRGIH